MSMERVGQQAPGSRHHGREFWALALELQRESGLTPAAFAGGRGSAIRLFGVGSVSYRNLIKWPTHRWHSCR